MKSIAFINPNSTKEMTESCIQAGLRCMSSGICLTGFTNQHGPPSIQGAADGELATPGLLSLIKSNQQMDGFIIGCFDNTGLEEARRLTKKPVIGIGQAAYHMACLTSARFTVLTTLDVSVPVITENIDNLGFSMWCDDVLASDVPVLELEFHPKGSSTGFDLATICGHRDGYKAGVFSGCQTECPGDNFYSILDTVRFHVFQRLIDCEFFIGSNNRSAQNDIIFSDGTIHLKSELNQDYYVFDLSGRLLISGQSNGNEIDLSRLPMGVFVVMLQTENRLKSFKIMNYGNQ